MYIFLLYFMKISYLSKITMPGIDNVSRLGNIWAVRGSRRGIGFGVTYLLSKQFKAQNYKFTNCNQWGLETRH